MGWARGILGLGLATALLACAAPPDEAQIEAALRRVAASVPALSREARVVVVEADSEMDAWTQVVQSKAEGPSGLARVLAQAFARAERASVDYVVGGPYPQLNERVVLDALGLVRAPRVPGLRLLFVSGKPPSEELGQRAGALGAKLLHRPFPEGARRGFRSSALQ
jgi:hypothetical protein